MNVGTRIKIKERAYSNIYELREGDFVIEFEQYPGFGGYYGEFNGKYFICIDTVDKYNPHFPGYVGKIEGLNLLNQDYEIVNPTTMTITNYKTPDSAIFGLNSKDERVYFKDIRAVTDNKELLELFKIRQKLFVINQIQVLDDNKAAFPLVHMTLFSIKNLAKVLSGKSQVGAEEICNTLEQIDPLFTEPVDLMKYVEFWDDRTWNDNPKLSYVFYQLAFLELKKGYSLDYGEDVTLQEWENAHFRLNPGWLWNRYKEFAEKVFDNLSEEQEQVVCDYIRTELL